MKADMQWQRVRPVRVTTRSENFRRALRKTLRKPQFWFGVVTLAPLLLWYATFAFWPVLQAFRLAVLNYHLLDPGSSRFVGLGNFQAIFSDPLFPLALGNSALWGIIGMGFGVPIALLISVCLANVRRGRQQYQTLIFVPVVLSLVAVLLLVRFLFDPENGPIDGILRNLHLPTSTFLGSSHTALPTAVGIGIWKGMGVTIVILTAGLLNIPGEMNDAARIDGANEWQRFWRVTLPLLQPTLNLIIVLGVIGALQEFTIPQVLTGGGPDNATYLLNVYIYQAAFQSLAFGRASAAALV
jgi:ABC-type sugar transport system permease subunit